jgi:hypothetical protein
VQHLISGLAGHRPHGVIICGRLIRTAASQATLFSAAPSLCGSFLFVLDQWAHGAYKSRSNGDVLSGTFAARELVEDPPIGALEAVRESDRRLPAVDLLY